MYSPRATRGSRGPIHVVVPPLHSLSLSLLFPILFICSSICLQFFFILSHRQQRVLFLFLSFNFLKSRNLFTTPCLSSVYVFRRNASITRTEISLFDPVSLISLFLTGVVLLRAAALSLPSGGGLPVVSS